MSYMGGDALQEICDRPVSSGVVLLDSFINFSLMHTLLLVLIVQSQMLWVHNSDLCLKNIASERNAS